MKKIIIALALVLVIVAPSAAMASAVVRSGDSVSVAQNQSVDGNFYGLGSAVALSGVIKGDAAVIGGTPSSL